MTVEHLMSSCREWAIYLFVGGAVCGAIALGAYIYGYSLFGDFGVLFTIISLSFATRCGQLEECARIFLELRAQYIHAGHSPDDLLLTYTFVLDFSTVFVPPGTFGAAMRMQYGNLERLRSRMVDHHLAGSSPVTA